MVKFDMLYDHFMLEPLISIIRTKTKEGRDPNIVSEICSQIQVEGHLPCATQQF